MDGFESPCYPGDRNAFHRQSQSGSLNHMAMNFPAMGHAQLPTAPSPNTAPRLSSGGTANYESHDDLCVEQCMGVGLYNGSQFFNHRGAPPAVAPRWPDQSQNQNPLYSFTHDIDASAMQYRPGIPHSQTAPYQSWFGERQPDLDQSLGDEECSSISCCDSQCTMTGKCSNIACANKEDACTDQNCPERPAAVPSEIVDGAAALISINHAPESNQAFLSFRQDAVLDSFDFGLPDPSDQDWLLSSMVSSVANHLVAAHGDPNSSTCTRPCLLDYPQIYPNCPMPTFNNMGEFGNQFGSGPGPQPTQDMVACKAEVHDPEAYIEHFNQQHRQFFTANSNSTAVPVAQPRRALPSVESASSSPDTPIDSADSVASNTPSPLTPVSHGLDMPDPKQEDMSPINRCMSEISEGTQIHRCLWREEGAPHLCDELFGSPEELFNHTASVHIKNAKKGDQGFRCGWHDCPRSKAGAPGFPQRSKIERHMQTHIDHKPHICSVCTKGFSAKQALNQHMFIHTDQKPLVCDICHKAFRYPSALTMHQRVHTGEKPLECPICKKKFSESSNLSKHKRTHELRGRFTCRVEGCDRNFHRQDQLRRHMKTHQKDGEQVEMLAAKFDSAFDA